MNFMQVAHNKIAHKCDICGKGFRHKQLLQRHSLVHTEDRPFICHICGATFKTRANLFNHNMIHTEDKPYECTQCDSKFTHKTSLVLHLRWHKGEKPFQCNVCNKFFSQVAHYFKFGEKPFGCEWCSKRFTTSSQHKLHMKVFLCLFNINKIFKNYFMVFRGTLENGRGSVNIAVKISCTRILGKHIYEGIKERNPSHAPSVPGHLRSSGRSRNTSGFIQVSLFITFYYDFQLTLNI